MIRGEEDDLEVVILNDEFIVSLDLELKVRNFLV